MDGAIRATSYDPSQLPVHLAALFYGTSRPHVCHSIARAINQEFKSGVDNILFKNDGYSLIGMFWVSFLSVLYHPNYYYKCEGKFVCLLHLLVHTTQPNIIFFFSVHFFMKIFWRAREDAGVGASNS